MLIKQNIISDVVSFNFNFRVVLSKAKDISRKPLQSVFSIRLATRTPFQILFSSSPSQSEGHIEKTIAIISQLFKNILD